MKAYILYGETKSSDGWFTVLGIEQSENPEEAFQKLKAETYWSELRELITDPEIRIREVGDLNYAYLSSTALRSTMNSAMNTGIWTSVGRQPLSGLYLWAL